MTARSKFFVGCAVVSTFTLLPLPWISAATQQTPLNIDAGQPAQTSMTRIRQSDMHMAEDASSVITDEMTVHMTGARVADVNKDYKTAADELRRVQAHVQSQTTALQNINSRLTQLIADVQAGKVSPTDLDKTFVQVRNATDRTHNWIPLASEEVDVFMPEMDYHLNRARQEWQAGQNRDASHNVWLAASYLRLRLDALPANKTNRRTALQHAEKTLNNLATDIQNHKRLDAKTIDDGFNEASAAWGGSF